MSSLPPLNEFPWRAMNPDLLSHHTASPSKDTQNFVRLFCLATHLEVDRLGCLGKLLYYAWLRKGTTWLLGQHRDITQGWSLIGLPYSPTYWMNLVMFISPTPYMAEKCSPTSATCKERVAKKGHFWLPFMSALYQTNDNTKGNLWSWSGPAANERV